MEHDTLRDIKKYQKYWESLWLAGICGFCSLRFYPQFIYSYGYFDADSL